MSGECFSNDPGKSGSHRWLRQKAMNGVTVNPHYDDNHDLMFSVHYDPKILDAIEERLLTVAGRDDMAGRILVDAAEYFVKDLPPETPPFPKEAI